MRSAVEFIIGRGDRIVLGEIGLTPRAKKVIELAVDEARRLNHHYIGTEHLLLGLVREGEGIAAGVLESLGVNLEKVRTQTIQVLSQSGVSQAGATTEDSVVGGVYGGFGNLGRTRKKPTDNRASSNLASEFAALAGCRRLTDGQQHRLWHASAGWPRYPRRNRNSGRDLHSAGGWDCYWRCVD